MNNLDVEFWVM